MRWPFGRKPTSTGNVTPPQERFVVLQAESDGLPELWIVNQALDAWPGRATFGWHLSLIIEMADVTEHGLPLPTEVEVLSALGEDIRSNLQADTNAVLLASVTGDGARQLVFRVRDPERANDYLQSLVGGDPQPARAMDYRMESDPSWALAENYLQHARGPMRGRTAAAN